MNATKNRPAAATSRDLAVFDPEQRQLQLKAHLTKMRAAMVEVLPKHLTADRLTKVVLSCTARTPALLRCSMPSIATCVMQAAELGLELGGLLGEAYLVPFNRSYKDAKGQWQKVLDAQIIIGYQGLLKLARQSGEVKNISSRVVYGGERVHFDFAAGTAHDKLSMQDLADRNESDDNIVGAYALVTLVSGEQVLEVMTRRQIETVRARSRAGSEGPWVTDYAAMCRKTVLRRISKYIPRSAEQLKTALEHEEHIEHGVIDVGGLATGDGARPTASLTDAVVQRMVAMAEDDDDAAFTEEEEGFDPPEPAPAPPPSASKPAGREPGVD